MYESSSLTIIYKYFFAPIWGAMLFGPLILLMESSDQASVDVFAPMLVMFSSGMVWLVILAVRLRRVTANNSHLTIISFRGNKKIHYKDIEYVSEAAFINPRLIILKYMEPETGEPDFILIMPSTTSQTFRLKFLHEHNMTQFIRKQIFIHKPNYSTQLEPSRWQILVFVVFSIVGPALLTEFVLMW